MERQREAAKEQCKMCLWKTKVGTNETGETFFCMFGNCYYEKEEKRKKENGFKSKAKSVYK